MNFEKVFGTKNLYEILNVDRDAPIADGLTDIHWFLSFFLIALIFTLTFIVLFIYLVKKNYYKLAKRYHPDKAAENEKAHAVEKFNVIHQAYNILCDAEKRAKYDAGSNILFCNASMSAQWEYFIKPISDEDVNNAREKYQNSENEKRDIQREYKQGNGSMVHMLNNIPFMRIEDEQRVIDIINEMINDGTITEKMKIKKILK